MRLCSRNRPMTLMTRMFSLTFGTPGRRQQMPRTIRSIFTPAARGFVEREDHILVDERVDLHDDPAGLPAPRQIALALDERLHPRREIERRDEQLLERGVLDEPRERVEETGDLLRKIAAASRAGSGRCKCGRSSGCNCPCRDARTGAAGPRSRRTTSSALQCVFRPTTP